MKLYFNVIIIVFLAFAASTKAAGSYFKKSYHLDSTDGKHWYMNQNVFALIHLSL